MAGFRDISGGTIARPIFSKFASLTNGGITFNANGNYAGAATYFGIAPPAGQVWVVRRVLIHISDTGTVDSDYYGNAITLTNCIQMELTDNSGNTIYNWMAEQRIYNNSDWGKFAFDHSIVNYGSGDSHILIRGSFHLAGNDGARLDGDLGHQMRVIVNDNLTGLNEHYFNFEGYYEKGRPA